MIKSTFLQILTDLTLTGWDSKLDAFQEPMRYLISAGVSVSIGRYGTFLDFFVGKAGTTQSSYRLISELIDAGGYITDYAVTRINQGAIRFMISHHPEGKHRHLPSTSGPR
jgi:hypothetical protein